jgi:endogenous inhibitor of DNA gyrase (YacG/DUF329 family)
MPGLVEHVGVRLPCRRCGKPSRLGDQPGYQIFECTECSYVDWIEKS